MINIDAKYESLIKQIESKAPFKPSFALVLGSGLGGFADSIKITTTIDIKELESYPLSTVQGHQGYIHFAEVHDTKTIIFQGRIHFYEGYSISECVLQAHIASKLGCKYFFATNAAGGINPDLNPGDLMFINDIGTIFIKKEITDLMGLASIKERNNHLKYPAKSLKDISIAAALDEKVHLKEGSYLYVKGPSYETPAEIKMFSKLDFDTVGMSTAHEITYAAAKGLQCGAISCVTNYASGISPNKKLGHHEVMETANKIADKFERLVKRLLYYIPE